MNKELKKRTTGKDSTFICGRIAKSKRIEWQWVSEIIQEPDGHIHFGFTRFRARALPLSRYWATRFKQISKTDYQINQLN